MVRLKSETLMGLPVAVSWADSRVRAHITERVGSELPNYQESRAGSPERLPSLRRACGFVGVESPA